MKTNSVFKGSVLFAVLMTIATFFFGKTLLDIPHLPDAGASWYYWKLPEITLGARISAWGGYILHQVLVWYFIYKLRKDKKTGEMGKYNYALLGVNGLFILLHMLQTHLFYDGLAMDVSVWSSQISVILMLCMILILENKRRGLFFGKKMKLPKNSESFIGKYHGFYIAWALTYTFWYHPMEGTPGHLFGFFYMFILMIQLSFAYTKIHVNPVWTFFLEVTVLFHGTAVAIGQGNNLWPMFFFGFGMILIVSQIYGLNLDKNEIYLIQGSYAIFAVLIYSGGLFGIKGIGNLYELIAIAMIEYLVVYILAFLVSKLYNNNFIFSRL